MGDELGPVAYVRAESAHYRLTSLRSAAHALLEIVNVLGKSSETGDMTNELEDR